MNTITFTDLMSEWEYDADTNMVRQVVCVGRPSTMFPVGAWVQLHNVPVIVLNKSVEFVVDPEDRIDGYRCSGRVLHMAVKTTEEVA